jgi:hypothetical protein
MPDTVDWWVVFVSDPERFLGVTGCAARLGELYAVTPALGIADDAHYALRGLSKKPLDVAPDGNQVRWNEARREFEPAGALARLFWRARRRLSRGEG